MVRSFIHRLADAKARRVIAARNAAYKPPTGHAGRGTAYRGGPKQFRRGAGGTRGGASSGNS